MTIKLLGKNILRIKRLILFITYLISLIKLN